MKKYLIILAFLPLVCWGQRNVYIQSDNGFVSFQNGIIETSIDTVIDISFIFNIDTDLGTGDNLTLPLRLGYLYDFIVYWGDGDQDTITAYDDSDITHTYTTGGEYQVKCDGLLQAWYFNNTADAVKFTSIAQWGEVGFIDMNGAFFGCSNFTVINDATDNVLSGNTTCANMFYGCTNFNGYVNNIDMSSNTSINNMFFECDNFNQEIDNWDVSLVSEMSNTFFGCNVFNKSINTWNTSNVVTMLQMFRNCSAYNQPMNNLDVSSVSNMQSLLQSATLFNQDLSSWVTSSLTNMRALFSGCINYDQSMDNWDTDLVTDMRSTFQSTSIDQDFSNWDVSSLTLAANMFLAATLSTANYDALLNSWAAQSVNSAVTFHGGNSKYSSFGETGRDILTDPPNNWIITDGGLTAGIYNPDAVSLFARTGDMPFDDKELISNTIDSLDDKGLWDKTYTFYSYAVHNDSVLIQDWKADRQLTYDSQRSKPNFFKYSGIEGLPFDDNILYGRTNFNMSEVARGDSVSIAFYTDDAYNLDAAVLNPLFGANDGTDRVYMQLGRVGQIRDARLNNTGFYNITPPDLKGMYTMSRLVDTLLLDYSGVNFYEATQAYTGLTDSSISVVASNEDGSFDSQSSNTISFWGVFDHLTESESSDLSDIIQNYMSDVESKKKAEIYENDFIKYKYSRGAGINNLPIVYQNGNQVLAAINDTVYMSIDGGITYPYSGYLGYSGSTRNIASGVMYSNNAINIFTEDNEFFRSLDSCKTFTQEDVYDTDSSVYQIHTPTVFTLPGSYFSLVSHIKRFNLNSGQEIAMWGNYVNVSKGAAPANVYYSADTGKSVRLAYKFGQSPNYRDDGTPNGGTTGTLLGDASNPILTRHIHDVAYSSTKDSVYFCTGDFAGETYWFNGAYNSTIDKWSFDTVVSMEFDAGRFKSTGLNIDDDTIYWFSDDEQGPVFDEGIFKCHLDDISNIGNHIKIFDVADVGLGMHKEGDELLAFAADSTWISSDKGLTWSDGFYLDHLAMNKTFSNISRSSNGWYSVSDMGRIFENGFFGGTILIKIK